MPEIEINIEGIKVFLVNLAQMPLHLMMWTVFKYIGWIPVVFIILWGIKEIYLMKMKSKYWKKQSFILLAVDIPKNNEQTPKAFENILNQLAGAHSPTWWWDLYKEGEHQQVFSLEIVSIEGHIQFVLHVHEATRDLVEASIYAQYPEAEITEIADYTKDMPDRFPNDEYELWGTEFVLVKDEVYPIKVYPAFGDPLTSDYKDPMAAFLEILSRIGKGEHVWYQIILEPIYQKWANRGRDEINKILGKPPKTKKKAIDALTDVPIAALRKTGEAIFTPPEAAPKKEEKKEINIMQLPPGEVNVLKMVEDKCSKIGYKVKIRLIYIAKHEVFKKTKVNFALVGAIKQYNTSDANSLKPDYKKIGTGGDYFRKAKKTKVLNKRRMDLMKGYRDRDPYIANKPFILNTEEIASLYHFPIMTVKAPLVKKIDFKTSEPPSNLPNQEIQGLETEKIDINEITEQDTAGEIDLSDDYFEKRFAVKDSKGENKKRKKTPTPPAKPPKPNDNSKQIEGEPPSNLPI